MATRPPQDPSKAALIASFNDHLGSLIGPVETATAADWRFMAGPADEAATLRARAWEALRANPSDLFPIRLPWYFGTELEFQRPSETCHQLFSHRSFDPNELDLLANVLTEGMTFIDVGANSGLYSVFAAKRVGAAGAVISFEPSLREAATLNRNIALNKLANVTAFELAVGEHNATSTLHIASDEYDGHNSLGGLALFRTFPNIRYTTDRSNYQWSSFASQLTEIPLGEADQVEVLIYADSPFEFDLLDLAIRPAGAAKGPWRVSAAGEYPATAPADLALDFSGAEVTQFGDLSLSAVGKALRITGRGPSGLAFRWKLNPAVKSRIAIDGQPVSDAATQKQSVEIVSLDSFLAGRPLKSVDVIKLDIEGHELPALRGAKGLIDKYKPLLMIEVVNNLLAGKGGALEELSAFLSSRGYACFDVVKGKPRPVDIAGEHGSNVIAAPERFLDAVLTLGGLARADMATDKAAGSTVPQSNKSNQVRKSA